MCADPPHKEEGKFSRSRGASLIRTRVFGTARHKGPPKLTNKRGRRSAEKRVVKQPRHTPGCCHPGLLRARRAPRMIRLHEPPACGRARLSTLRRGFRRRANAVESVQAARHAIRRVRALPAPLTAPKPSTWHAGLATCRRGRCPDRPGAECMAPPAGTALARLSGNTFRPKSPSHGEQRRLCVYHIWRQSQGKYSGAVRLDRAGIRRLYARRS
jgi:hypothetical protein